jgi:hypothetical protein
MGARGLDDDSGGEQHEDPEAAKNERDVRGQRHGLSAKNPAAAAQDRRIHRRGPRMIHTIAAIANNDQPDDRNAEVCHHHSRKGSAPWRSPARRP